jgi:hypothetical protein
MKVSNAIAVLLIRFAESPPSIAVSQARSLHLVRVRARRSSRKNESRSAAPNAPSSLTADQRQDLLAGHGALRGERARLIIEQQEVLVDLLGLGGRRRANPG